VPEMKLPSRSAIVGLRISNLKFQISIFGLLCVTILAGWQAGEFHRRIIRRFQDGNLWRRHRFESRDGLSARRAIHHGRGWRQCE